MNIIELMKLPVGTKMKTNINSSLIFEIVEDECKDKYLTLEGDLRKAFISNIMAEGEFYLID